VRFSLNRQLPQPQVCWLSRWRRKNKPARTCPGPCNLR
jgi:hypothetical protein